MELERRETVNRKREQRLMRLMGLVATYPEPRPSAAGRRHRIYPYLLRGATIERPEQVWSADVTYVPMASSCMYLAATIDWFRRYVVAWRVSNTLDGTFCTEMLDDALVQGRPEVFNTDQGVQFTAEAFTGRLESAGVAVSMDGRGRAMDNVLVERLWRAVKYEDVSIQDYEDVRKLRRGLARCFAFYFTRTSGCTVRWVAGPRRRSTRCRCLATEGYPCRRARDNLDANRRSAGPEPGDL